MRTFANSIWGPTVLLPILFAVSLVTRQTAIAENGAVIVWPINAALLVALLASRQQRWPLYLLSFLAAEYLTGVYQDDNGSNVIFAAINGGSMVLLAMLVRLHEDQAWFTVTGKNAARLGVYACFVVAPIAATFGTLGYLWLQPDTVFLERWRMWWIGDVVTILVSLPPLLIIIFRPAYMLRGYFNRTLAISSAITVVALFAVATLVFTPLADEIYTPLSPSVLLLLLTILAAIAPPLVTAVSLTLLGALVIICSNAGHGPFSRLATVDAQVVALQEFMVSASLLTMVLLFALAEARRSAERLALEVKERKKAQHELSKSLDQASQASRAKSEFLASMSHDLRTPLNAVLGFAEVLRMRAGEKLNEKELGYIEDIKSSGTRLQRLVDDLLDITAIEAGHLSLSPEPIAIKPFIDACMTELEPMAARYGVTLKADVQAQLLDRKMLVDSKRLHQIISNICSNGIKYNRPGGYVGLAVALDHDFLEITVRDNGVGISKQAQQKVFDLFNRAENAYLSKDGMGIGLATSRMIVDIMGGRIKLESDLGVGTTVRIHIPAIPYDPTEGKAA